MLRRDLLISFLLSFALVCVSGCGPGQGDFEPAPPPPPVVTIVSVSDPTPNVGDTVEIRWKFSQDDNADANPNMRKQAVQFHSLTFEGSVFTQTQGCLPESLLNGQEPLPCFEDNIRASTFVFAGPVMFDLIVEDNNGEIIEKLIKFTIPGASFRVSAETRGFLGDSTQSVATTNVPRIGAAPGNSFGEVLFERAFGIFEVADNNGNEDIVIDDIAENPILSQLFSAADPFLLTMTANIEEQQSPQGGFFFVSNRGRNFPILETGFLFDTPDGQQFQGVRTHADAIIFAGTLAASGTIERLDGREGETEIITANSHPTEPMFLQIDVRSNDANPQQFFISDVRFGNSVQRLVFSAFRSHISPLAPGTRGEHTLNINTNQIPLLTSGNIKGAVTGFNLRLFDGTNFIPAQAQVSADWSNIPMFPDNDISGLERSYIRFTP